MTLEEIFNNTIITSIDKQEDSLGVYYQLYDNNWKVIEGGKNDIRSLEELQKVINSFLF